MPPFIVQNVAGATCNHSLCQNRQQPPFQQHCSICQHQPNMNTCVCPNDNNDLAVIFRGSNAAMFKPSQQSINRDGEPTTLGSLDEETELHMVDVHGSPPCKLQGETTGPTAISSQKCSSIEQTVSLSKTIPNLINFHHVTP